jgi:CHAT domain-containing protein
VQSYGDDVQLDNSGNLTTSNANVTFAGTVNSQAGETNALSVNAGTGTITFGNAVGNSNALGNLSLTGDEINFGYTLTGTGDLIIQPSTAGLGSDIGGYSDTSSLDLTLSEIGFLQNGFNSITIGRSNGGNMTISGGTFNDPVILQSGSAIELTLSTTIRGLGNASVTLNAPTILNPDIITTDQDITLIGAVSFFYSVTLNTGNVGGGNITINGAVTEITPGFERLRLSAGSGNITITGDVGLPDRPLGSIEANTTGTTLFNSAVNAASLTTDAGGTTRLTGNVTTTGTAGQSYGDNLRIDNNISLTGDEINFANTVTGTGDLTIQPFTTARAIAIGGSGDTDSLDLTRAEIDLLQNGFNSITIGRINGGNMTIAGATFRDPVVLRSGSAIAVNGTITGADNASITLNAPTILNPNITTTDQDITLNGGVSLGNSVALNTGATGRGNINITGTVNGTSPGSQSLTLTAGSGDITITGAVGSTSLDNLTINNARNVTAVSINALSITQTAGTGTTIFNGGLTANSINLTNNSFNLNGAIDTTVGGVTLTANQGITTGKITSTTGDISLTSNQGDITVNSINTETGDVNITASEGSIRLLNTIPSTNISISSGNSVTITSGTTLFTVGDATRNGTAGDITGGGGTIFALPNFIVPGGTYRHTQGDITIITPIGLLPLPDPLIQLPNDFDSDPVDPLPLPEPVDPLPLPEPVDPLPLPEPVDPLPLPEPVDQATDDFSSISIDLQGTAALALDDVASSEQDLTKPILRSTTRDEIISFLDQGKIAEAVPLIDTLYSEELGAYIDQRQTLELRSLAQMQQRLNAIASQTGEKPAIIYTFARPEQLDLVLVTSQGAPIHKSIRTANREVLLLSIKELRSQITNPHKVRTTSYKESAQQLYQWLIAPLEADLNSQGINTLVFSMDTGLRAIPLAALHDGNQFLVEKYSLGLIPSLNLTDTRYQSLKDAHVLAMGASEFVEEKPLPAVPVELSIITSKLWPGKSFLNDAFTLENLKSQRASQSFELIHLATHGEFQPGQPNNSFIQLWNTKLRLDQLRQLGWNNPPVELLVLSACRTALGDEQAELGFAGFAVQAGVKSAMASLWSVSDEGTLGLMTEFYQQLRKTPIKAQALRQAQLAMLKGEVRLQGGHLRSRGENVSLPPQLMNRPDKTLHHPYYWGAFTIIGSPW